jgi:hypothetical protein
LSSEAVAVVHVKRLEDSVDDEKSGRLGSLGVSQDNRWSCTVQQGSVSFLFHPHPQPRRTRRHHTCSCHCSALVPPPPVHLSPSPSSCPLPEPKSLPAASAPCPPFGLLLLSLLIRFPSILHVSLGPSCRRLHSMGGPAWQAAHAQLPQSVGHHLTRAQYGVSIEKLEKLEKLQ